MSPMSSKVFKLDAEGLAQCFDTSAGVGLAGRGVADLNKRKRGLPFWMLPCSLLLLALCAWYGLRGVAWGVGHELGKAPGRMQKAANSALVAVAPKAPSSVDPVVPVSVSQGNLASVNVRPPEPVADTNEIFCTGFVILGRTVSVFLSNGSTIDSGSGRISLVTAAWVTVDGVKLPVRTGNVSVPVPAYFEKKSTLSYAAEAPEKISVSDALVLQALASPSVVPSVQPSVVVTPSLGHGVPLPSISGVH